MPTFAFPLSFVQVIVGSGIPDASHVKVTEPELELTIVKRGVAVVFGGSGTFIMMIYNTTY